MIVEEQTGADHPRGPQVRLVRQHERQRLDEQMQCRIVTTHRAFRAGDTISEVAAVGRRPDVQAAVDASGVSEGMVLVYQKVWKLRQGGGRLGRGARE